MSRMTYLFWCGLAEEKWSRSALWRLRRSALIAERRDDAGDSGNEDQSEETIWRYLTRILGELR
jgi:hypothetical protein